MVNKRSIYRSIRGKFKMSFNAQFKMSVKSQFKMLIKGQKCNQ